MSDTTPNPAAEDHTSDPPDNYDYTHLRRVIGLLAISIGIITPILADKPLSSVSASYWANDLIYLVTAHDFFVGGLCVVSAFLLAYQGRGKWESRFSRAGCLAAVMIAFFPTAPDDCATGGTEIHGYAAFALFAILLVFIWGFATQAGIKTRPKRKLFYQFCAGMIFIFLVIGAYGIFGMEHPERVQSRIIFVSEVGALSFFGIAWLVAGTYKWWEETFGS